MTYQYTNETNQVVTDGNGWSGLVSAQEVQEWVAMGHAILAADALVRSPLDEIAKIEQENPISHRNLRDLTLSVAQLAGQVLGVDPMVNPAVKTVSEISAHIDALRAQAKVQGLIP